MAGEGYLAQSKSLVLSDQRGDLKVAYGNHTSVAASDTVATGLSVVLTAVASLQDAPALTDFWVSADVGDQAGTPAAGSILIKTYKPTGAADVTPLAASGFGVAINWIAFGY